MKTQEYSYPCVTLSNTLACAKIPRASIHSFLGVSLMKRYRKSLAATFLISLLAGCGSSDAGKEGGDAKAASASGDTAYFYGARIIPGDASPVLEDMSIISV